MKYNHTFVLPVYNDSPYLESCIKNLLKQSVKSNIIITTPTPTAKTRKIAESYKIKYYINEEEKTNIGDNWNFGLSKVETMYATIAHQDDIYAPTFVEEVLSKIKKDNLIAFTDYYNIIKDKKVSLSLNHIIKKTLLLPFLIKKTHKSSFIKKSILLFGDPICCPAVTFNLKNINEDKGIFSSDYICALDWVAWLKIAKKKGSFTFINKKLFQHRIHENSTTTELLNSGIRNKEEFKIFQKIWGTTIAKIISYFYAISHKGNIIK